MPLRREITTLDRASLRPQALDTFGLRGDRPTLLVTGGSSGAVRVNEPVAAAAAAFRAAGVQVLHITGLGKEVAVPAAGPNDPAYVVLPYADRMDLAYAAADLVVTRSGGNMVCETSTIGLPAIFVPLPVGNGEQRLNAADVVAAGGALLVDNDDFTVEYLRQQVIPLIQDRDRLGQMSQAARGQGHGEADERLVDMIEAAAHG